MAVDYYQLFYVTQHKRRVKRANCDIVDIAKVL